MATDSGLPPLEPPVHFTEEQALADAASLRAESGREVSPSGSAARSVPTCETQADSRDAPIPDDEQACSSWASASKNTRPLPRRARLALLGGCLLLCAVAFSSRCNSTSGDGVAASLLHDDLLVSEEELSKRKETTRDAFAIGPYERRPEMAARAQPAPPAAAEESPPAADPKALDLAERRRRRRQNPEDIRSRAGRQRKRAGAPTQPAAGSGVHLPTFVELDEGGEHAEAGTRPAKRVIAVGDLVPARLLRGVTLRSGSETVVAVVASDRLPKGTKIVGRARIDGERASVRFSRLVLPGGEDQRLDAEARGTDGEPGLPGVLRGGEVERDDGSVAGDVARGTGRRLIQGFSGGMVGGAADDALTSQERRGRSGRRAPSQRALELDTGTRFEVLFLSPVNV